MWTIEKQVLGDNQKLLEKLISRYETQFAREFLRLVKQIKDETTVARLAKLITDGNVDQAIQLANNRLVTMADIVVQAEIVSAQETAAFIGNSLNSVVSFDQTNVNAVNQIRASRLNLIREITTAQQDTFRSVLTDGIRRGVNPRQQAREMLDSVGLTRRQTEAVQNYRRLLEEGSSDALRRGLRDRRFDSTVRRAVTDKDVLSKAQIDKMVGRYNERYLRFRAETIARTEALRVAHEGTDLMFEQALENGSIKSEELERTWVTARDGDVRDSHDGMNGQKREWNQPFVSDAGALLMRPGDSSAPADEVIQCRCVLATRIVRRREAA